MTKTRVRERAPRDTSQRGHQRSHESPPTDKRHCKVLRERERQSAHCGQRSGQCPVNSQTNNTTPSNLFFSQAKLRLHTPMPSSISSVLGHGYDISRVMHVAKHKTRQQMQTIEFPSIFSIPITISKSFSISTTPGLYSHPPCQRLAWTAPIAANSISISISCLAYPDRITNSHSTLKLYRTVTSLVQVT